jgi:branched-chain amino acid transport system permease protein
MFGVGAYVTARLLLTTATPLPVAWLLGGVVAGVYALAWGHPTLRLRGPYFAIATIGVGEATRLVMTYWEGFTGGSSGLSLPIQPQLKHALYWYALYFLGLVVIASYVLRKSRIGLGLLAIKSDVDAAGDVGVSATFYQDVVLLCSGIVVGIAGGFYASYFAFLEPVDVFGFDRSISFVLMGVIGGIGTILGPLLGAIVFVILQQVLIASYPQLYLGLYGSLLILAILFEPLGITGLSLRLARRLGYRPLQTVPTGILGSAADAGRGVGVPAAED